MPDVQVEHRQAIETAQEQPAPAAPADGVDSNYRYWREHGGEWVEHYDRRKKRQILYHIQELMLTTYMLEHVNAGYAKPLRVLEFGCGVGRHLRNLNRLPGVDVHGYDQSLAMAEGMVRWSGSEWFNSHVKVGSPTGALPFADGEFDIVYSAEVLVHVRPEHIDGILREMVRVCRGHVLHIETSEHTALVDGEHSGCWRHDLPAAYARLGLTCEVLPSGYEAHSPYRVTVKRPAVWTWPPAIIEMYRRMERDIDEGFESLTSAAWRASQLEGSVSELQRRVQTLDASLAEHAAALGAAQANLATAEAQSAASVARAVDAETVLTAARDLISAKDDLIAELQRAVAAQAEEIGAAASRIRAFEARIVELDAAIAQAADLRAQLSAEGDALRAQFAEMSNARDVALADGAQARALLGEEIAALRSQHVEMTAARDSVVAQLAAAQSHMATMDQKWAADRATVAGLLRERQQFIEGLSQSLALR